MHWLSRRFDTFSPEALQQLQLSPSRQAYLRRLRRQEDRDRSLAAEFLLRQLLCGLGIPDGVLHRKANGQPYLTGCDLYVSISHCPQMVACAVSADPVGIDMEPIVPFKPRLCRLVCTPEEADYVLAGTAFPEDTLCPDPDVQQRFFEIWTGKEAYFKKCGTGITDLKSVNILSLPRQVHLTEGHMIQLL